MLIKSDKTVAVAMSGGVDSSAGAVILKNKGYSVIGVSMHLISKEVNSSGGLKTCCSTEDIIDAKRVCVKIGIPHFVISLENEFKTAVIDRFVAEYLDGKTPNPCILCNCVMKFDLLLKRIKELGADYLATGHYARITKNKVGQYFLLKSKDLAKDQSYVLYNLSQENLKNIIFPVGNLNKRQTRKIASDAGFGEISDKKDSVEICFVPDKNYAEFIKKQSGYLSNNCLKSGFIKNLKGEVIGEHNGIFNYTVGQRKKLGISSKSPLYVVKISAEDNEIVVGNIEDCFTRILTVKDFHFINPEDKNRLQKMKTTAKIRYSSPDYKCKASISKDGSVEIVFDDKVKFVTPGQSAVLYSGIKVIGGGVIG
ncbi:MAG: tRNA 2-thiouridine(34) synthase MnmA [bacterium]